MLALNRPYRRHNKQYLVDPSTYPSCQPAYHCLCLMYVCSHYVYGWLLVSVFPSSVDRVGSLEIARNDDDRAESIMKRGAPPESKRARQKRISLLVDERCRKPTTSSSRQQRASAGVGRSEASEPRPSAYLAPLIRLFKECSRSPAAAGAVCGRLCLESTSSLFKTSPKRVAPPPPLGGGARIL